MALNTKTFTRLVQDWVAAAQGASSALLDFTVGSILRAIAEAQAGVALWLQGLVLRLLATTRLATSSGADAESFVADFGVTKLPAVSATGLATFARFTPTNDAVVPVGALAQTADGTQSFAVYADTANPLYSATLGGYVIAATVSSGAIPVQAITPGSGGNIVAGALTVLQTGISGIDTVTNAADFINGRDAETDAELRARFIAFINSLSKGTTGAFAFAISSAQPGVQYALKENEDYAGTPDDGLVTVVIDDGSGAASAALLAAVQDALEGVRAAGIRVATFAAVILQADIEMQLTTAAGYDHTALTGQIETALQKYVDGLGLGNRLSITRLSQIAYDTSPGVTNVSGVLINGGTADLVPSYKQTVKSDDVTVT